MSSFPNPVPIRTLFVPCREKNPRYFQILYFLTSKDQDRSKSPFPCPFLLRTSILQFQSYVYPTTALSILVGDLMEYGVKVNVRGSGKFSWVEKKIRKIFEGEFLLKKS
jgi:hypothetical protein